LRDIGIDNICFEGNVTPLWVACQAGHFEVAQTLCEAKADSHLDALDLTAFFIRPQPLTLNQVMAKHEFKIAHVLCWAIASQVMRLCQAKVCLRYLEVAGLTSHPKRRDVAFETYVINADVAQPGLATNTVAQTQTNVQLEKGYEQHSFRQTQT
jgi:hypothetical protein